MLRHCAAWARQQFEDLFSSNVRKLLAAFPPGHTTSNGMPFWSGPRRCPTPVDFDPACPMHVDFVAAAGRLRASVYGLNHGTTPDAEFAKWAAEAEVGRWQDGAGGSGVPQMAADDEELKRLEEEKRRKAEQAGADDETVAERRKLESTLPDRKMLAGLKLRPVDFDKDTDLHMTLVAAASNLRATNYSIDTADKLRSRLIAGRITPAIATTTAIVVGLIQMELYKLVQGKSRVEDYRMAFVNLSVPFFSVTEPAPCEGTVVTLPPAARYQPQGLALLPPSSEGAEAEGDNKGEEGSRRWRWTMWDSLEVQGPMTLEALLAWLQDQFGSEPEMVNFGPAMLYASFQQMMMPKEKKERRMQSTVVQLAEEVTKKPVPFARGQRSAMELIVGLEDEDLVLPPIKYIVSEEEVVAARANRQALGVVGGEEEEEDGEGEVAAGGADG